MTYHERAARLRSTPEARRLQAFPRMPEWEAQDLAAELRATDPRLSDDQALDAATLLLPELEQWADSWNEWATQRWLTALMWKVYR